MTPPVMDRGEPTPVTYTPGPWEMCDDSGASPSIRPAGTGWLIAAINRHTPLADDDPSGHWKANGRLIAAAPDVYEALKSALELAEECRRHGLAHMIKSAIAKAEGTRP